MSSDLKEDQCFDFVLVAFVYMRIEICNTVIYRLCACSGTNSRLSFDTEKQMTSTLTRTASVRNELFPELSTDLLPVKIQACEIKMWCDSPSCGTCSQKCPADNDHRRDS